MDLVWALAACAALNVALRPSQNKSFNPNALLVSPRHAIEDEGFLALGMRRAAADTAYIRLLVYYGVPEPGVEEDILENGGGSYPDFFLLARTILDWDSRFRGATLYAASVLAFNLRRPLEAAALLNQAIARNPKDSKYPALLAAVGVANGGDAEKIVDFLDPVLSAPDCPTYLKSLAAFLCARAGKIKEATNLYQDIARTSQDNGYRRLALTMLARLHQKF
ncbi:MAG: tetratricopeptide repeat protein [Elusimicrobiota bacterium]